MCPTIESCPNPWNQLSISCSKFLFVKACFWSPSILSMCIGLSLECIAHTLRTLHTHILNISGPGHEKRGMHRHWHSLRKKYTLPLVSGNNLYFVLPLFGNDTSRQTFVVFTPFFRQISQFLNFRNKIYRTWGFQQCMAWPTKVPKNTCWLLHKKMANFR